MKSPKAAMRDPASNSTGPAATRTEKRRSTWLAADALTASIVFLTIALTSPAAAQSRGEMLYSNHCLACHTTQIHWRDKRSATDWASLTNQVRRWQGVLLLKWSDEEIRDVAEHLNNRFYGFEPIHTTLCESASANDPKRQTASANCKRESAGG